MKQADTVQSVLRAVWGEAEVVHSDVRVAWDAYRGLHHQGEGLRHVVAVRHVVQVNLTQQRSAVWPQSTVQADLLPHPLVDVPPILPVEAGQHHLPAPRLPAVQRQVARAAPVQVREPSAGPASTSAARRRQTQQHWQRH